MRNLILLLTFLTSVVVLPTSCEKEELPVEPETVVDDGDCVERSITFTTSTGDKTIPYWKCPSGCASVGISFYPFGTPNNYYLSHRDCND